MDDELVTTSGEDPRALAVVPESALTLGAEIVPMAGTWASSVEGGMHFTPAFAPVPGMSYVLLAQAPQDQTPWRVRGRAVAPGPPPVPSTRVLALDPDVVVVPENLLRFSISFSAEMDEGGVGAHVHLRTPGGSPIHGALLPMPPELWDRPRQRLTVLLEPGRLKRGLRPHAEAGPPLQEGAAITLAVDQQAKDATGAPLAAGAERTYQVGPAVRSRIDPTTWTTHWPQIAGEPLVVGFGRPLDRALLARCLRVVDGAGQPVAGRSFVASGGSEWTFAPTDPPSTDWTLHVDPDLEDLAGNSVRRVFDQDLRDPEQEPLATSGLILQSNGNLIVADEATCI